MLLTELMALPHGFVGLNGLPGGVGLECSRTHCRAVAAQRFADVMRTRVPGVSLGCRF